jgi:hypothetical protein
MGPEQNGRGGTQRWRQRGAWAAGLTLFSLETAQSVLLLPLLPLWLPMADISLWLSMTAGWGLVNAAASAYAQPLVRNVARRGQQLDMPSNWQALRDKSDRAGLLLLAGFLCVFATSVFWQMSDVSPSTTAAALLFFGAMGLKLFALNRFVWLNGMGQIGRDKRILLTGSAVTLISALVLAPAYGALWSLCLASLLGAVTTATVAAQVVRRLGHRAQGPSVDWPLRPEMAGLVLLNLCGYLFVGTDVLIGTQLLPPSQIVSYAFWSRALGAVYLLAGMYAQISFPRWSQASAQGLRSELQRALTAALLLPALFVLAYVAMKQTRLGLTLCQLPLWMFTTLATTMALSCAVVVCGQFSNSRGGVAFMMPSALVAAAAPALALAMTVVWQAQGFVFGYGLAAAALVLINVRHAFGALAVAPAP